MDIIYGQYPLKNYKIQRNHQEEHNIDHKSKIFPINTRRRHKSADYTQVKFRQKKLKINIKKIENILKKKLKLHSLKKIENKFIKTN